MSKNCEERYCWDCSDFGCCEESNSAYEEFRLRLDEEVISMFKVVNKRNYSGVGIYIGRPSVLGNPFHIGRDGNRVEVIEKYRRWLWGEIQKHGEVYDELVRLLELEENASELTLICHCKPLACHGDVIVRALNWLFYQLYDEESMGK